MFTYCKEQPCGAKRKASAYSFDYYLRVAMGLTFTFIILIMIIIINKMWILFDIIGHLHIADFFALRCAQGYFSEFSAK